MAETKQLKLFLPGSDDTVGVEDSLASNFQKIDDKLGTALIDQSGKAWDSLGARLNETGEKFDQLEKDVGSVVEEQESIRLADRFLRMVAHRGASKYAPENTIPAYKAAIDAGYWGVETDIQLTKDGTWVLIHDDTIDRTSDGTGTVRNMTFSEVRAFDYGYKTRGAMWKYTKIPNLDEFLKIVRLGRVIPYIEIKGEGYTDTQIQSLLKKIDSYGMLREVVLLSFSLANLKKVRYYNQETTLGYVVNTVTETVCKDAKALKNAFVDAKSSGIDKDVVDMAKKYGLRVEAWTVDTSEENRRLAALGIKGMTTNVMPTTRGY